MKALLDDKKGLAAGLIRAAGGDPAAALKGVEAALAKLPSVEGAGAGQVHPTRELVRFFEQTEQLAEKAGDNFVTAERMLIALALSQDTGAANALATAGVNPQSLNTSINELRQGRIADSATAEDQYEALKKYTRDLTQAASDSKIDPVIGRDEEIRRTMQVLSRRTKNNPVLIGEPGVGKTAIVEGLAQRIVNGDVPEGLKKFEERLKGGAPGGRSPGRGGHPFHRRAAYPDRRGSGRRGDGRLQHAEAGLGARRAALRRRHHPRRVPQAYREGRSLARRFQPVFVAEPTVEDTISILRGLKEKYELHHGVRITDGAPSSPRRPCPTAISPTVSCRTRRSTWWTRRRAACAWRWIPSRRKSTSSTAASSS